MAKIHLLLVVVLPIIFPGCLSDLADERPEPCSTPAEAEDGTLVQPDEPYWTLQQDRVPIPDGQERVDQIRTIVITHNGRSVEAITRGTVVDGQSWIERWWACRLDSLEPIPVAEGSEFTLTAESMDATQVSMSFTFRHPDGLEIGYPADPDWQEEGHLLSRRLGQIEEGHHDVYASVIYPDGSSRTHQFVVDYRDDEETEGS